MILPIDTRVPYSSLLDCWLCFHDLPFNHLVEYSRRYERAYLAWESVRRTRNPFFQQGTGFEGYFVGINHSPEEMLTSLLDIGHQMLASNCRLYHYNFTFQTKLMHTLNGEISDARAIHVWSASLGAVLGKLRCNIYSNSETWRFQNETYWTVNRLPLMHYCRKDHQVEQEYVLVTESANGFPKPELALNVLKPSDRDAGLVIQTIGCFGHPLIRAYLQESERNG